MSTDCCNERTVDGENELVADSLLVEGPSVFDGPTTFLDTISATDIQCTNLTATSTVTCDILSANTLDLSLTPSQAVQTDITGQLATVPNTGSGNNVLATSPTLVTPILGAAAATSLTLGTPLGVVYGGTGQTDLSLVTVGAATVAGTANTANTATTATTATKATNIAGGLVGRIPVQTAVDTTTFINPGVTGTVLTSAGLSLQPVFSTINGVPNLNGGVTGDIPYQQVPNTTLFISPGAAGKVLKSAGAGQIPFYDDYLPENLSGGANGRIPVQTSATTTTFITPGASGTVLTSNGVSSLPTYQIIPTATSGTFSPILSSNGVPVTLLLGVGKWCHTGSITVMSLFIASSGAWMPNAALQTMVITGLPAWASMGGAPFSTPFNRCPASTVSIRYANSFPSFNTNGIHAEFTDNVPSEIRFYGNCTNIEVLFQESGVIQRFIELTFTWLT